MSEILKAINCAGGRGLSTVPIEGIVNMTNTSGTAVTDFNSASNYAPLLWCSGLRKSETTISSSDSGSGFYLGFGTGTTSVTENDYKLASFISSGLSVSIASQSATNTVNDECTECTRTLTCIVNLTNTDSSTNVTISEIGFYQVYYPTSSKNVFLVHREVLSSPITIEPNAVATFTFTFTFVNSVA